MIFAAGLGTRLRPLTDNTPKALIKVGDKPLLQHTIEKLKYYGFDEIIINVHHFADQIINFIEINSSFGIRIEFSDESNKLLDTGGGIKKASHFFNDNKPFLIHNVDILSNLNLKEFYLYHQKSNSIASLVCSKRNTSRYLLFNSVNQLTGWINKETGDIKSPNQIGDLKQYNEMAFSGIHILNTSIFNYMVDFPEKFSIIDFYLSLCKSQRIGAFYSEDLKMIDVGKINSLNEAEKFLYL